MANETAPKDNAQEPDRGVPSEERKSELRAAYQEDTDAPYNGVEIRTLGELLWIFSERNWSGEYTPPDGMTHPILTGADLHEATLTMTYLSGAKLDKVNLFGATLTGAYLFGATLTGADLRCATLTRADLGRATLAGADLREAKLDKANLRSAKLDKVDLSEATLTGADLTWATLTGAHLNGATLEDANLSEADVSEAILRRTLFSAKTTLDGITWKAPPLLLGTRWNDAPLDEVDWNQIQPARLGDEAAIHISNNRRELVRAYRNSVRAYHGLVVALEDQGLVESARHFRQRERTLERRALLASPRTWGVYLFYTLLNLVSGQGEEPQRILVAYGLIISVFTAVYWAVSNLFATSSQPLLWYEALVLSLSSFHGRGFFPSQIGLGDPLAIVAAVEAVIGLFIELILIATFSNRFLNK